MASGGEQKKMDVRVRDVHRARDRPAALPGAGIVGVMG